MQLKWYVLWSSFNWEAEKHWGSGTENPGCTEHYGDSTAVDVGVGVSLAPDITYNRNHQWVPVLSTLIVTRFCVFESRRLFLGNLSSHLMIETEDLLRPYLCAQACSWPCDGEWLRAVFSIQSNAQIHFSLLLGGKVTLKWVCFIETIFDGLEDSVETLFVTPRERAPPSPELHFINKTS